MGAYLNKPITQKHSEEGEGNGLKFGASTMQGWRISQEDAHNCCIDLVDGWSMFAVYDGHGGSEVSKYASLNLPDFLKKSEFWKNEDLVQLLEKIFIEFDDHIRSNEVMTQLKQLAMESKEKTGDAPEDSDDEGDRIKTLEESRMPLEQILARYGFALRMGPSPDQPRSSTAQDIMEESDDDASVREKKKRHSKSNPMDQAQVKRAKTDMENDDPEDPKPSEKNDEEAPLESAKKVSEKAADVKDAPEEPQPTVVKTKTKKSIDSNDSPKGKLESIEAESSDEEDADFDGEAADEEDEEDGEEDEEEEAGDEDEDEEEDEGEEEQFALPAMGSDTPGDDSGTTACVCLINKEKIVVANVGDSRAVLSRGGVAINLSEDHKPEDERERTRIEKAGGTVNADGRVNGGLNLSRAFGDHCYKKNNDLKLEEQMICALPDVKIEDLKPEDEFLVVACDGIWNSMESQPVVDFVRAGFAAGKSCQKIAEELCDRCLAPTSHGDQGDGSGCDNETCIVIQVNQ